ncbi:carboxypeptidase-like regulatory domain-containing protein [Sphingobacterium sp. LRF_L2]|uniref:TonB-dependent receptor n=1 Tax=Sphingobacterium sp. LRF_L2 TaxID=3369421 RepID=UPI003F5FA10D
MQRQLTYIFKITKLGITPMRIILLLVFSIAQHVYAQQTVQGHVVDASTNRPLEAVSVQIKGNTHKAITDRNGNFTISIPREGTVLVFRHIGYQQKEITASTSRVEVALTVVTNTIDAVTVNNSKRVNTEMALLEERRKAGIIQDGISAELMERTASITVTQALQRVVGVTVTDDKYVAIRGLGDRSVIGQLNGARLASSNPDRAAIPLDLVPASLLDNITIFKTFTPDKPADAASGIIDLKTKSVPDSMVFEVIAQTGYNSNIGIGGRYNSFHNSEMGILGTRINQKNLRQDFLDLADQYPNGLGSIQRFIANSNYDVAAQQEMSRINGIMQSFDQNLTTKYRNAPVNQLYSVSFGNSYNVFKKHKLGVILGGNYYRRTTDIYEGELTQWSVYQGVVTGNPYVYSRRNIPNYITPNNLYLGKYQTYKENTGTEILNYGVLGGLAYRFSPRHEIGGQFMGSWGGENAATNMHGSYEYTGLPGDVNSYIYSLKQTYRNLYTYQFHGEHKFLASEYSPRLSYSVSTSVSRHNDPDYRFVSLADYMPTGGGRYTRNVTTDENSPYDFSETVATDHLYALTSGYVNGYGTYGIIQAEPNGRRWRHLEENNYNYKADLLLPFRLLGAKQEFKIGTNYLHRKRVFTENQLFIPGSNFSNRGADALYDVNGDLNRLVSNEIVGVRLPSSPVGEGAMPLSGFIYNSQKSPNNYDGYYETNAFYGMLDIKPIKKLRLTGGVRFETTDMGSIVDTAGVFLDPSLTTPSSDGTKVPLLLIEPNSLYRTGYKPFYALNAVYSLKDGYMNIRGAYNTTLARPELREITNVFEYDAFQMGLVVGNPSLKNQTTQNLDFRWEWFTGPGEVIAVSAFGKRIHNQLIKVFSLQTEGLAATYPEFPVIRFENEPNIGQVWGMEFEVVKDLGKVYEPLRHFFLGANLMLAQSDIKKSEQRYQANLTLDRNTPKNSPLFEQAPYSVNTWLNYANKRWGSDFTATFNMVGERLVQINLMGEPDLYSMPVPMLDLVWSQRIHKRLVFKGYAKNILNPAIKTVYANPETGGTWYGKEYIQRSYKRGAEIMMGFTLNIY